MLFANFLTILSLIITPTHSNLDRSTLLIKMISDVQNYYKSSTTILVNSKNIFIKFSRNRQTSFSLAIEISQIVDNFDRTSNPFYVIFLNDLTSINELKNISRNVKMSRSYWFVIFDNEYLMREMKNEGNVFHLDLQTQMLVTCLTKDNDRMEIEEWYGLRYGKTIIQPFAFWNNYQKFQLIQTNDAKNSILKRRSNLFGEILRIVYVKESPFVNFKNGTLEGFFGNIIRELEKVMNFTLEIKGASVYGNWDKKKNHWTGCLGQIVDGYADIGVTEFTITIERKNVVDFSVPILVSKNRIYVTQFTDQVHWVAYFQAFDYGIWLSLVSIILTTPVVLALIKSRGSITSIVLFDHYIQIWGIYCQQGLSEFPIRDSTRIAYFSIFLSALIISSAYSASLISYLTIVTINLPFNNIEEFSNQNSHKLIVINSSSDYDLFAHSENQVLSRAGLKMKKPSQLPSSISEAVEQICREKYLAFYTNEAMFNSIPIDPECKMYSIESGDSDNLAMALSKNNPYIELINYHLQRFIDNGMMKRWKNEFFMNRRNKITSNSFQGETVHVPVQVLGIAPLLAVVACGIVLSLFIVCFERLWFSRKRKY